VDLVDPLGVLMTYKVEWVTPRGVWVTSEFRIIPTSFLENGKSFLQDQFVSDFIVDATTTG
jgi:hypothetical protein